MDYFRNMLGGPQGEGQTPSGAETVERLCERVSSSTLLDDRRDAVRALKALSKKFRLEVGTQAMDILINVLEQDRNDAEITGFTLDTLYHVMSNEPTDEEDTSAPVDSDLGGQFTEIFIKKSDNVSLLLSFLEEYDFHVRWPTVKLLTVLLTNRQKDLQEIILVIPMGVSRLMDLLSDSREIIRNDALLLLNQLTKGHANIQKIVAFENAFERIIDIIRDEGASDGGIVVEDCLLLLQNLLRNNASNQNFFKEGSFVQRLTPFFELESENSNKQGGWSAQKVTNMHLLLQLVRTLVSPNNPQNQTVACQKVMNQCGLLQELCSILMASGVPADVLTETINTVSEVIRGSTANQEYFASVLAPSTPPRPAIVVLLMSMVNEKQPFVLRCAVLYCFQSFLCKNEVGQSQIIQTLLPTAADANSITAGQLLCGGLFSADPLSNWFASVALLHAIVENHTQKEQLLRVQLATSLGNPPVSLLQQCCNMLSQGGKFQTRIGLLMVLCGWLCDCPIAVSHFLSNTANVPYLISQVSSSEGEEHEAIVQGLCAFLLGICMLYNDDKSEAFSKSALKQVIQNRIGLESFTDKLTQVAQNENYTRAAKKPHLYYKHPNEIVFDYSFTRLFKSLENEVLKAVSGSGGAINGRTLLGGDEDQYKALLREQEEVLSGLRQQLEEMQGQNSASERRVAELTDQVQQLRDQNALLKAHKGSQGTPPPVAASPSGASAEEVESLQREVDSLRSQLTEKDAQLQASAAGGDEDKENNPDGGAVLQASLARLQGEVASRDQEISGLKAEVTRLTTELQQKSTQSAEASSPESDAATAELQSRLQASESQVAALTEERNSLQERVKKSNEENLKLASNVRTLEEEKQNAGGDLREEMETLKKEQDDLLVLLADQDAKIDKYKTKLKELGQEVEDDDDDDDLDDDDDDDDEGDAD
ncbi:general vesicular transport factor p115 [Aplysia californica]|uniref:General vesicular transport factor p115 n=1 Tax=Aplysia californica TaxID=6500 RepID=A0ABM0JC37_APLCA|nr:general vesicular transport factor p115 [Aplysia californica]